MDLHCTANCFRESNFRFSGHSIPASLQYKVRSFHGQMLMPFHPIRFKYLIDGTQNCENLLQRPESKKETQTLVDKTQLHM